MTAGTGTAAGALAPTGFLDFDSAPVRDFVHRSVRAGGTPREQAVDLYLAVRDGVRYEVYGADLSRAGLRASTVARVGSGMCIHKSVLFAAGLRSLGVPARLVFADVRNHLSSPRLRELVGGDVFRQHCYTSVFLDDRWVKATPVFNRSLCRLFRIAVLDFDGTADSLHHPYDLDGRKHMEFLRVHGEFDDVPHERVLADLREGHPDLLGPDDRVVAGSLRTDIGARP
ncbi:transglutaminase-like domain-containing protein [Actinokineospora bangkokensis]|uniref:Transglutaminase-like superfamily protein n=1 Tax=Actinokineospora bangkokensis TaxID=1193682 RepID=A0A1Q9LTJ2_9PSEU|nr:transglutaminase-like domain-containing protein [Actinokineospora bangkokensis]OLR95319.1 transglutaminase-like superfamily protein [Actinokineospora bangkokensis]